MVVRSLSGICRDDSGGRLFETLTACAGDRALAIESVAFRGAEVLARSVSRAELLDSVMRAADGIQRESAPGERVIIALPPGPDFLTAFLGCLMSGRIAVPAQTPGTARARAHLSRLQDVTRATIVLTNDDVILAGPAAPLQCPAPRDIAYLQFTSGSTTEPRGAVVTHGALDANLAAIRAAWRLGPDDRGVFWLPPWHDMGLVGALLTPIAHRFPATLLHPAAFLQRPERWLQLITSRRATFSGGPNFAYDLCVDRIDAAARRDLDLSAWRIAVNGAEPIRTATLHRFAEAFGPCGFKARALKPGYGLAESVLFVAACGEDDHLIESRGRVSCGRPAASVDLRIVDEAGGAPAPDGEVGAIWVRGPSLAHGYWDAAESSNETFNAHLPGDPEPWLRTGDLGWTEEGALFVCGRSKDVIIRAGRKAHAADIEYAIQEHHSGGARVAVLTMQDGAGAERLVVLHDAPPDAQLEQRILDVLGRDFDLIADEIVAVAPGLIQLTSSGKIARAATRAAWIALHSSLNHTAA